MQEEIWKKALLTKIMKRQILLQDAVHIKLFTGIKELEELTGKKSTESHCKQLC